MATLAGKCCHVCSLLTAILTIAAYITTKIEGRHVADSSTELQHFHMATLILGTAWVLEFIEVTASSLHGRGTVDDADVVSILPRSHLVRWTDSQLMVVVYSVLFSFYSVMAAGSFGVVNIDPFASNRPVYGLRYVEWSLAVPILMTLVGRSIPRQAHAAPVELAPAIILTVVYIYASWLALIIDSYPWRIVLIIISFVGYAIATWDQYNWTSGLKRDAPSCRLICGLLLFQVALFGVYGIVYLVAGWDIVTPVMEQALYTFGDATAKVGHSAVLLAIRQQDLLAAVRAARREAAIAATDLARLIDAASTPILRMNLEGRIITWNSKLVELTGRSAESMQGFKLLDVVSSQCRDEVAAAIQTCIEGKRDSSQCFHADLLVADADCNAPSDQKQLGIVPIIMNASMQHDLAGANAGLVCVGVDRTEVVHYQEVEKRKNRFMATVSHELRSPLHGICGLVAGLESNEADKTRRRQLAMVKNSATRLLDLVVNIMDMSAQRNNQQKALAKDPVHLPAVLEEVVALVGNATDRAMQPLLSKDCTLTDKVSGTPLPLVEGDAYKLTQVFFNILTNACKFCRKGRIEVSADVDHFTRTVHVSISDTGIGIAPDSIKRIFEPFEQEESSDARRFEGIGIGLSVSKGVVEQHGGEIIVKSVQGQGSSFIVCLPFVPNTSARFKERRETLRASSIIESMSTSSPNSASLEMPTTALCNPKRAQPALAPCLPSAETNATPPIVLSVDDDIVNHEVIISALPGYKVHTAMDGAAALEYFSKNSRLPDVVLLDIMMPGMDGFEVCKAIRDRLRMSAAMLPIIMLSAKEPAPESVVEGLGVGCNDYISKPFNPQVLVARVQTALKVKRLHSVELENAQRADLLHEIMPPSIVQRLLSGESCISESHQCVTILFSDIVGWTNIAEAISTSAVITLLNEMFSAFDVMLEKHGVFKVETIGDAYMVAAGHDGCHDHAERVIRFGLAMLEAVKSVRAPPNMQLQIRVGVHSGPAFTGVVGQKVPRFCFFGDTVNVSSRMESNGIPGCIHLSQKARDCLGGIDLAGASMISRGAIDVKGKGRMETHVIVPRGVPPPRLEQEKPKSLAPLANAEMEKLRIDLSEAISAMAALRTERDELQRNCNHLDGLTKQMRVASTGHVANAESEKLRMELAEANSTIAAVRAERDELQQHCSQLDNVSKQVRISTSASTCSTSTDISTTALQLELVVKKKALERARRALIAKDDEIDAKELELQHALMALNDAGLPYASLPCTIANTPSEEAQLRQRKVNGLSAFVGTY